jgi:hypothetical protein
VLWTGVGVKCCFICVVVVSGAMLGILSVVLYALGGVYCDAMWYGVVLFLCCCGVSC